MSSLVSGYEALITWGEELTCHGFDLVERTEPGGDLDRPSRKPPRNPQGAADYLKAERARVARFRQDMGFLDRRRIAEAV